MAAHDHSVVDSMRNDLGSALLAHEDRSACASQNAVGAVSAAGDCGDVLERTSSAARGSTGFSTPVRKRAKSASHAQMLCALTDKDLLGSASKRYDASLVGSSSSMLTRERADVADLQRMLFRREHHKGLAPRLRRSRSLCDAELRLMRSPELRALRLMREPGGFRREFLHARAAGEGRSFEQRPKVWASRLIDTLKNATLVLEGHKFGLELGDDDGAGSVYSGAFAPQDTQKLSNVGVGLAIFKGNVGGAVLYMPCAWKHGGYALSSVLVPVVGFAAIISALRLVEARMGRGGNYGDLVELALGRCGRRLINMFIILLQCGTCCSYFIVCAQLLQSTILHHVDVSFLIFGLAIAMVPLVAIRKVSLLWPFTLLGTILTLIGIFLVLGLEIGVAADNEFDDLFAANTNGVFVCLGTACFMFEGIGLVLPTYDSSACPHRFSSVYSCVMMAVLALVSAVGFLGYLAYGEQTNPLVLLNLPEGLLQTTIRLAFVVQLVCSFPLQLLPAVRLVEDLFFTPVSSPPLGRKCAKTAFRAIFVSFLALISVFGSSSLDNFVSLVGALCGMPLAFVFPAICHLNLVESSARFQRVANLTLIVGGTVLMVVVTCVNVLAWIRLGKA